MSRLERTKYFSNNFHIREDTGITHVDINLINDRLPELDMKANVHNKRKRKKSDKR